MFVNLLLLLCFVSLCETATKPVRGIKGIKGGSVTLSCDVPDREIFLVVLSRFSRITLLCENEECKSKNWRVFKEGSCHVVIKDLIYRDAGKYILSVYYINNQEELEPLTTEYQLHIHDEISVKAGDELKLDVLMINADKVEYQSRNSTEWKKVWTRGHGVIGDQREGQGVSRDQREGYGVIRGRQEGHGVIRERQEGYGVIRDRREGYGVIRDRLEGHGVISDRLNVSDESLIIKEFTDTDAGTFRVLDFNKILITVTVTESGSAKEHKDSLRSAPDPQSSSKKLSVNWGFIVIIIVCSVCCAAQMRPRAVRTGLGFLSIKPHKSYSIFYRVWLRWRAESFPTS